MNSRIRRMEEWANSPAGHHATEQEFYTMGVYDRKEGKPCRSANGAYLDGWYAVPSRHRHRIVG